MSGKLISNSARLRCLLLAWTLTTVSGCQVLEHKILYAPKSAERSWQQPRATELAGLCFEDACFSSSDGTQLHGWFVKPANVEPENVILFAHGRMGNVSTHKTRLFEFVRRHQVAVLIFDYRGYGKSEGCPSEVGLYVDTAAARDWLAKRTASEPAEIIIMGRSLGSAVAIDLASRDGAKALIIENGFTSTSDVLQHHTHQILEGRHLRASFNSASKIGKYSGPVFVSHGEKDRAIPFAQGVRLAELATSASQVHFVKLQGGHMTRPTADYEATLDEFLKSL
jgi:fermentation-respiration switch protein FrsA (DUF1100 family)